MTPQLCIPISTPTLRAMLDYQGDHDSELDPASLADIAIRDWLKRQLELAKPAGKRGYFWKTLFLPEGTRLRISSHTVTRYAAVVGDDLVYNAMNVSPNQFVQMTLGSTRSAWDAIQVQMPGEREWKLAIRLRYALEAETRRSPKRAVTATGEAPPRPAPAAPAAPATRALPDGALLTPQRRPDCEERRRSYRRAEDLLLD